MAIIALLGQNLQDFLITFDLIGWNSWSLIDYVTWINQTLSIPALLPPWISAVRLSPIMRAELG